MVNLIVKEIIEEDFGCEGRPEGHVPMCRVLVRDYDGNEMYISVLDKPVSYTHLRAHET